MTDRIVTSTYQNFAPYRSHSFRDSRDKVNRTVSALHRQTVDRAQRRFEQQLADRERELRWAVNQRRDYSSTPGEKIQATQYLEHLRTTLNNDYTKLVQEEVDQVERYMNRRHAEERQFEKTTTQRQLKEAIEETHIQSERDRLNSIHQIARQRDAVCEAKLASQQNFYLRLLDEQARRLYSERVLQANGSLIYFEPLDMTQVKGRLARVEYENWELKQLVTGLHTDLSALSIQQPIVYRSTVHIPNFA